MALQRSRRIGSRSSLASPLQPLNAKRLFGPRFGDGRANATRRVLAAADPNGVGQGTNDPGRFDRL